jgi:hypothetical protein
MLRRFCFYFIFHRERRIEADRNTAIVSESIFLKNIF